MKIKNSNTIVEDFSYLEDLANTRLHDMKSPLFGISGFSEQLPKSKGRDKIYSQSDQAIKLLNSHLAIKGITQNKFYREHFVDKLKDLLDSVEGPILAIKPKNDEEAQICEMIMYCYSLADKRIKDLYADYSSDSLYNIITGVCHQTRNNIFSLGKRTNFSYGLGEELKRINASVDDFFNVCAIPINNSLESMGRDGNLGIYSQVMGDHLEISIRDNGKGIPPHILAKLNNPQEMGVTYGKKNGSGFGIPTLRQIIKKYDGILGIVSEDGRTEVSMNIPLEHLAFQKNKTGQVK